MKKPVVASLVLGAVATAMIAPFAIADDEEKSKPKHTIKEVMKVAFKGGLQKKVLSGEASDDEKKELLDLYVSLVESKPPKGEMNSWHNLAGGAALAAAKVVVGREGALDELKAATNCKACHSEHKP
ncbi:MAG: hypothetical protein AAGG44_01100 [Planctomycetota bacterium]